MKTEYNVKRVPAAHIFEIAEESFSDGRAVKITVVGNSMYPFLRNKIDSVELYKEDYASVKINDIVVARRESSFVLHRVHKKNKDSFVLFGDGNLAADKVVYSKEDLICKASAIYRRDKRISCSSLSFRLLSAVWRLLRPFRKCIFKTYRFFRGGVF